MPDQITLQGKTQKGKNRIRENGSIWEVITKQDHVIFGSEEPGPWLYITPLNKKVDDKAARWIHQFNDPDFLVTAYTNNLTGA